MGRGGEGRKEREMGRGRNGRIDLVIIILMGSYIFRVCSYGCGPCNLWYAAD